MPVLRVVENVEGSQFHGKYFAGYHGLEQGRGGPVLSPDIARAKIMSEAECRRVVRELSAWHTFEIIEAA